MKWTTCVWPAIPNIYIPTCTWTCVDSQPCRMVDSRTYSFFTESFRDVLSRDPNWMLLQQPECGPKPTHSWATPHCWGTLWTSRQVGRCGVNSLQHSWPVQLSGETVMRLERAYVFTAEWSCATRRYRSERSMASWMTVPLYSSRVTSKLIRTAVLPLLQV